MVLIGNADFLGFRTYVSKSDGKVRALVDLRSDDRNITVQCPDVDILKSIPQYHKVAVTLRLSFFNNVPSLSLQAIEKSN